MCVCTRRLKKMKPPREFDHDSLPWCAQIWYAACFTFGGMIGAALMSLSDTFGRQPIIRYANAVALICTALLSIPGLSWAGILVFRFVQGWSYFMMTYAFSAWYTEFLPVSRIPHACRENLKACCRDHLYEAASISRVHAADSSPRGFPRVSVCACACADVCVS